MKFDSDPNFDMRIASAACLLLISAVGAAQQPTQYERRVDSLFAQYSQGVQPGLALAVVRDGKVVLTKGYGYADLEHRVPITPSTVFDVASVSKQFTGLAIAMLVTEGRIKLADDIRTHIPELAKLDHVVTIDHLLHHTSGYRDWPGSLSLAGWRFDDVISFDQILRMAYNQHSLNFVPGAEYTYSNTGYNLLAETIARVTHESFRHWTDTHLFQPLGMTSSHFLDDHRDLVPNRAYGYARQQGGRWANVTDNLTALGSSSLYSTVEDMAKWVMNFDDPKVGGAAAMTLTRTRGRLNDGSTIPYAFGVSHGDYRGQPTISHSGGWASFSTYVLHFPQQHFGVIVFANGAAVNPGRAAFNIADIYLGNALGPAPRPNALASGQTVTVAPATLDRYAGLYRLGPGWYVRITRAGTTLSTHATREMPVAMSARSDTSFWVQMYNAPMYFHATAGSPTQLTYRDKQYAKLDEPPRPTREQLQQFVGDYESPELATRYHVAVDDSGLVMTHYRLGTIRLTPLWKDDFGGSAWFTRSVEFLRDASGGVTGFSVYIDERSRDIRFTRVGS